MNRTTRITGWACLLLTMTAGLGCEKSKPKKPPHVASEEQASPPPPDLMAMRSTFKPTFRDPTATPPKEGTVDVPPAEVYSLVRYPAQPGKLAAYLTLPPKDKSAKLPAVVWIHGGFGGIGAYYGWRQPPNNDQTPRAFIDAGFVVMLPSFRGTNDNPGKPEMFYGEVDDALAAVDYVASLPYVDKNRIYVIGHSTGGTIALLTAEAAPAGKIRAVFSFGGAPDMYQFLVGDNLRLCPFDTTDAKEMDLRSPHLFIGSLKTPTWYFEGSSSAHVGPAKVMADEADAAGVPFHEIIVDGGTHFDILRPTTKLIAEKLKADTGPTLNLDIPDTDVQSAYTAAKAGMQNKPLLPKIRIGQKLANDLAAILKRKATADSGPLVYQLNIDLAGKPDMGYEPIKYRSPGEALVSIGGSPLLLVDPFVAAEYGPMLIDSDPITRRLTLTPDTGTAEQSRSGR